jgi:hypothetical protein
MPTLAIDVPAAVPEQQVFRKGTDFDRPGAGRPRRAWRLGTALTGIGAVLAIVGYFGWRSGEFPVNSAAPMATPVAEHAKPAETNSDPVQETTPAPGTAADAKDTDAADSTPQASAAPAELAVPSGNASAAVPASVAPAGQLLGKPSPMVPPPPSDTETGIRETVRIPPATPQDVWVTSNPPGAKAVMDGEVSRGCATPCMLQATAGVHHLTVAQEGFQTEYREIHVGDGASEVPTITLRQPTGTLMLMTSPAGANIWINGQMLEQTTPAQLSLSPGSYKVTVAKDGRTQTQEIQLHENPLYLRIPLSQ